MGGCVRAPSTFRQEGGADSAVIPVARCSWPVGCRLFDRRYGNSINKFKGGTPRGRAHACSPLLSRSSALCAAPSRLLYGFRSLAATNTHLMCIVYIPGKTVCSGVPSLPRPRPRARLSARSAFASRHSRSSPRHRYIFNHYYHYRALSAAQIYYLHSNYINYYSFSLPSFSGGSQYLYRAYTRVIIGGHVYEERF